MKTRIISIVIVGILLRLLTAYAFLPDQPQGEDGPSYATQALEVVAGSDAHYYFPPGTSFVVAPVYGIMGRTVAVDHAIGVVLTSGVVIVSVWFSVILLGWSRSTMIVAILASCYGHTILAATQISSQPVTAIAVVAVVGLTIQCLRTWSWTRWGLASLAMAIAVLTRPASGLVVAVCAAAILYHAWQRHVSGTQAIGACLITALVLTAAVLPVMQHNARAGQGMTISTNNEWNLLLSNTPYTPDYKTGHFGQRGFDQIDPDAAAWLAACIPHRNPAQASLEERRSMTNAALTYMGEHPWRTLYRITNRARGYWGMDYSATRLIQQAYGMSNRAALPLLAFEAGTYLLVIIAALSAFFIGVQLGGLHGRLIVLVIVAGMLPYLVAFALPRFHLPAIPLIMPLAALAIARLGEAPREHLRTLVRSRWWWTVIILVLSLQVEHFYHLARLQ